MFMVPVRKCQDELLVIVMPIRRLRIVDDERPSKAIRILALIMRMIPVCT